VGAITRNGLSVVLSNLAEIQYNVEWQDIRASDLGAPHKRERIWIITYPNSSRNNDEVILEKKRNLGEYINNTSLFTWNKIQYERKREGYKNNRSTPPKLCRVDDGVSKELDRLQCLGNSIVPQIAELLFKRLKEIV
jgi:DNA (cytosine-5)-methyltransferase 1